MPDDKPNGTPDHIQEAVDKVVAQQPPVGQVRMVPYTLNLMTGRKIEVLLPEDIQPLECLSAMYAFIQTFDQQMAKWANRGLVLPPGVTLKREGA